MPAAAPAAVMPVAPPPPEQSAVREQPIEETVNPLGPLLSEDHKLVTVASDDESKEGEKPPPLCPSDQQRNPTDIDDHCDPYPRRNFLDLDERRDYGDDDYAIDRGRYNRNGYQYCDDPRYRGNVGYQYHHGDRRYRGNGGYPFRHDDQRDHRNRGYPSHHDDQRDHRIDCFSFRYNPMDSLDTECATLCCSPQPIYGKKSYPVGASLSNPCGWTCFLNCILQCVVHTVPLALKLLKDDHPDPCPRASDGFCCYCSLKLHADESITLSGNVLYPKKFVDCLEIILPEFEEGRHQDAHEFLCCLLDKLGEASVAPSSPSEKPSSTEENNIVEEIFGGHLKSQLHCPECNHCSDKLEPFLDLNLEVDDMDTVMDALQSFTKVEVIEGFMCDGCKSRVNMEKHLKVEQAPEVLVIQLKRFKNKGGGISKISTMVKYQLELDLNPFMSSPNNKLPKYDLYGVVEHLGVTSKGHYICYIRSSQTDWYLFNDERVYKASEASVLDNKAYLLLYVKQGSSPWFSSLLERKNWLPLDASKKLAEQGFIELSVSNDNEEVSTSFHKQDIADYCLSRPAGENEIGPSLLDFSQEFQGNANGCTLLDVLGKKEESCSLGGPSEETLLLSCLSESCSENGYVGGLTLLFENKENDSLQGSQHTKEMDHSIHGSSKTDVAGTQGRSPQKNENSCSLLQSSYKNEEYNCSYKISSASQRGYAPQGSKQQPRTLITSAETGTAALIRTSANSSNELWG